MNQSQINICNHQEANQYIYLKAQNRAESLICQECRYKYEFDEKYLISIKDGLVINSFDHQVEFQIFDLRLKINKMLDSIKNTKQNLLKVTINDIQEKIQSQQQPKIDQLFEVYDILRSDGREIKVQLINELSLSIQEYQQQKSQVIEIPAIEQRIKSQILNVPQQPDVTLSWNGVCLIQNHFNQPIQYINMDITDGHPLKCKNCKDQLQDSQNIVPLNQLTLERLITIYNTENKKTFDSIDKCSFTLINYDHSQIQTIFNNHIQTQKESNVTDIIKIICQKQDYSFKFLAMVKKEFDQNQQKVVLYKFTHNLETLDNVNFVCNYDKNMILIKIDRNYIKYRLKLIYKQQILVMGVTNIDTVNWNQLLDEKDKKKYFHMISSIGRLYSLQNGQREGTSKEEQWSAYKFEDNDQLIEYSHGQVKLLLGNPAKIPNNYTFKVKVALGDFICIYFLEKNSIELELM